ncbi:MAG TPA: DUF1501 domain-containing protein [Planctomycetes bacterium]|jgi:hypothetical protein|nr:DUF1501 domain-containing protein [Planctomycetota bacterium]
MPDNHEFNLTMTRRQLLGRTGLGLGSVALASLLDTDLLAGDKQRVGGLPEFPNFAPKAKRVIYLFQSGAPSQFELLDHKPKLEKLHGELLKPDFFKGQRQTGMTAKQEKRVCKSIYTFSKHGESGAELSELLPHLGRVADDLCIVRTVQTQAINHDPAITFFQTGFQQAGRPSIGAWASYGLGSENANLPAYVVMVSQGSGKRDSQALYGRLWGSGFLPSAHQGVKFRSSGDPVLYLSNPPGIDAQRRRELLDLSNSLNTTHFEQAGDPETITRIKQAELAFRMQTSVPELMDTSKEPEHIFGLYGESARRPGTYAANCLLARRLAERGVRFIQLYHRGWDQHGDLPRDLPLQCGDVDQGSAALVSDLKQRGMLDETLIIWGGEFGRTVYAQGKLDMKRYGRDHHPRCFSIWMAGGGIKSGLTYGASDDFSFDVVQDPVHVYDLHATMLHCLGVDHERLTYKFQGRHHRLTDVHGNVVHDLLA